MTLNKQPALDAIEKEQNTILHVADEIWDYAELSLQEFRSAKLYCEVLKAGGLPRGGGRVRHRHRVCRKLWLRAAAHRHSGRV